MDASRRWNIAIIGAGVVGTSLGCALKARGHAVTGVASRSIERARQAAERIGGAPVHGSNAAAAATAEIVFLTVPDRAIGPACAEIAAGGGFRAGTRVLHTSGALDSAALEPARRAGCETGSLHPLQSFASVDSALRLFPETYFFYEGSVPLGAVVAGLVGELGGVFAPLAPGGKALYHAAAAIACNYLVTLAHEAVELMAAAGVARPTALPALLPLLRGTLHNLTAEGLPNALTGPIARGDTATVARHLAAFRERAAGVEELYRVLGRHTVPIGLAKGSLGPAAAQELAELLGAGA